jgi:tripartite-type tricarboxylate transporter receptor subunit TctC
MKTLSTLEQEARKRAGPRYSWPFGVALLVLGVSLLLFGLPATAQPQLTGRTVTILVGYTAGGGYDRFARIVARHLPRYLPGTPAVVVQNMPGAESVVAANHLFNAARPDGLTIGLFNRNLVFAQLVGVAGVRFDVRRWQWIGNLAEETDVFVIRADLPYRHILEEQWGADFYGRARTAVGQPAISASI